MPENAPGRQRDYVGYANQPPEGHWPGGARLAISLVINYEEGSERTLTAGDDDQETGGEWGSYDYPANTRNLAVESMFEYGSRIGIWRLLSLLEQHGIKATFFACAKALEVNSSVAEAIAASEHAVVSHGYRWEEHFRLSRESERERIQMALDSFESTLGFRPRGWYCRYGPSVHTRELLVENGAFDYDCDAYNDDQPYFVDVAGHEHLVVPYTPDVNDFKFWQNPGFVTGRQFYEYLKDSFDVLYAESENTPRILSVGLHPRMIGRAGRLAGLRDFIDYARGFDGAIFMTRDEIADAWPALSGREPFARSTPGA